MDDQQIFPRFRVSALVSDQKIHNHAVLAMQSGPESETRGKRTEKGLYADLHAVRV